MRRLRVLSTLLVLLVASVAHGTSVHVYLVVLDGLGADQLDGAAMPFLADDRALDPVAVRGESRAVMPTRTNPNHATLLTGLFAAGHGITGNTYWDGVAPIASRLEDARLFEAETLFTVAKTTRPELVTMAAFSKAKLGRMFDATNGRQRAPDVLWTPSEGGFGAKVFGITSDVETMDAFLAASADREPDLAVLNLSEVDQQGHQYGTGATMEARRGADAGIAALVHDLRRRGRWQRSVLIVTADHGLDDVAATPERADPSIVLSQRFADAGLTDLRVAGDGGVAHVYAASKGDDRERATLLGWAAAIAWREPGVSEVLAVVPVDGVPSVEAAHPDWRVGHRRSGDLLVVAATGYQLVDPPDSYTVRFAGNHGSAGQQRIPLVVAGGALRGPARRLDPPPSSADVGATIARLLDLRMPKRFDGGPAASGTPIALPLAAGD